MKIFCIADNADLEVGMKFAGEDSITLESEEEINSKIDEIIKMKQIGILVVTEKIYEKAKEKLDKIRLNQKLPLITII